MRGTLMAPFISFRAVLTLGVRQVDRISRSQEHDRWVFRSFSDKRPSRSVAAHVPEDSEKERSLMRSCAAGRPPTGSSSHLTTTGTTLNDRPAAAAGVNRGG